MKDTIDVKHLSRKEKLRIMEAIWEELSSGEESIQSPVWHEEVLRETENRLRTGQEQIFDWKDAKKELRKRFE